MRASSIFEQYIDGKSVFLEKTLGVHKDTAKTILAYRLGYTSYDKLWCDSNSEQVLSVIDRSKSPTPDLSDQEFQALRGFVVDQISALTSVGIFEQKGYKSIGYCLSECVLTGRFDQLTKDEVMYLYACFFSGEGYPENDLLGQDNSLVNTMHFHKRYLCRSRARFHINDRRLGFNAYVQALMGPKSREQVVVCELDSYNVHSMIGTCEYKNEYERRKAINEIRSELESCEFQAIKGYIIWFYWQLTEYQLADELFVLCVNGSDLHLASGCSIARRVAEYFIKNGASMSRHCDQQVGLLLKR